MKKFILLNTLLCLAACASVDSQPKKPVAQIDRLSAEELARIMPKPVSLMSLEALVALSKEGLTPQQVIEKLKLTDTGYDLTPSQMLDLNKQGVDMQVLDYIHNNRIISLQNNLTDVINQHEKAKFDEIQLLKQQLQLQRLNDPFLYGGYPHIYPYGIGSRFRSGWGLGIGRPWYW